MDESQSERRSGPMVLLIAVLAMLGIRTFAPDPVPFSGDRAKYGEERPIREGQKEDGDSVEAVTSEAERFAKTLTDFQTISSLSEIQHQLKEFIGNEDLRCIIACVPDPVDSGSGDRFDTLIDAIQRAAETQEYVLDRFYYPWPRVKEPAKSLRVGPVEFASTDERNIKKMHASLSFQFPSPGEERPWKRLPGMLLFHTPPDSHTKPEYHRGLLLIFLVGETATAGLHKDAFMTSLKLLKQSREYKLGSEDKKNTKNLRPPGRVDVLGPCFSGSQVSLEKIIQECAKPKFWDPKLSFNLISGNATAIQKDRLEAICKDKVKVTFRATVVPEEAVIGALVEYLKLGSLEQNGDFNFRTNFAILCESNTDYGHKMKNEMRLHGNGPTHFPFPLHIAAVRSAYDKPTGATGGNTVRLPSFGSRLQLRLRGANATRETEPSLAPEMTAVTTERTLADMLATIARERFRHVFILATDIKDEMFLANLVREYCPESRLVFTDTDLLLDHPDFSANLRGSIIGSTYPMHFRNQNWSYPFNGRDARFTFPGPREQGSYNALIALLNPMDSRHLREYGPPFPMLGTEEESDIPPIWISIIGEGGLYPLKAVSITKDTVYEQFRDYLFQAKKPSDFSDETTFRPLHPTLWMVPVLGISLLLLCLGWRYGAVLQKQSPSSMKKSLFWPRAHCRAMQRFYVLVCLTSVFFVYWYLTFVWLIPTVRWLQLDKNPPVRMHGWNCVTPIVLTIILPFVFACLVRNWSRRIRVLVVYLLTALITWLVYTGRLPGTWQPGEDLMFFERATNLANGVTPVVPIVMLGMAFFCWSCVQLKRLYLLDEHEVGNPFYSKESPPVFEEVNKHHAEIDARLKAPWKDVNKYSVAIAGIVLLFICCRLYVHFVPTVEGIITETSLRFALVVLALLIVCGWVHLRKVWDSIHRLLHAISLLPLAGAFAHIPSAVTNMFGPNLTSERPGRRGHLHYQREQHDLLRQEYQQIVKDLPADALPPVLAVEMESSMKSCPSDPDNPEKSSDHLIVTARVCLRMLGHIWKDPCLTARLLEQFSEETSDTGLPSNNPSVVITKRVQTGGILTTIDETIKPHEADKAVRRWLARVRDFVALEVTFYLSQFFVQLRNMALFLSLAPFLLLLAVSSYPFQPQRLWVWLAVALIGLVTLSIISIVIQIERNELVSRILKTTPNQISFRWGFFSHLFLYAIPLLGILVAMSSDMSDLVHSWMDPLLQVLK